MTEIVSYKHNLGEYGLSAFAVDPKITQNELEELVKSKDGTSKFDLTRLSQDIAHKGTLNSISELNVQALNEPYKVPEKLRPYREALEEKLVKQGKFNGPICVLDGEFGKNIQLRRGGYFDFMATKLEIVPAELVPDRYPAGVTVEELMKEHGIKNEERARYLGFAFLISPDSGKEFQLVQRAKGMGIAADCISSSGSTPEFKENFFDIGFDFGEYYKSHICKEMDEEFKMKEDEFIINQGYLIDDKKTLPHIAWKIKTQNTTKEMAQKIYGNQESIKEHPILYDMPPDAISVFLKRFDMWPSVAYISNLFYNDEVLKK